MLKLYYVALTFFKQKSNKFGAKGYKPWFRTVYR